MQIGTATLKNLTLYVYDPPVGFPGQGILGADFLAQFVVTVDYEHQRMSLTLPDKFRYKGKGELLPFTVDADDNLCVTGSIAGVPGRFEVYTTSSGGLELSASFAQSNHLRDQYPQLVEYPAGTAVAGTPVTAWYARDNTLMLGKTLPVHNTLVGLTNRSYSQDGMLGGEVLRQFTLTLDWPHRRFYLEKNALYGKKAVFNRAGFIPTIAPDGFDILFVMANSPASDAGLKVGDHLVNIAGRPAKVWTLLKLRDVVRGEPGMKLPLTVERDGRTFPLVLTLRDLL